MRKGLHGADVRLVDATKLSADQNTSVNIASIFFDHALRTIYGVREGGADETVLHILDVDKHEELPDVLPRARYSGVSLSPDKQGIYYARLEKAGTLVYFHKLGQPVDSDQVIFGKKFGDETFGPMELISASVSQNGRYLVISVGTRRTGKARRYLRERFAGCGLAYQADHPRDRQPLRRRELR